MIVFVISLDDDNMQLVRDNVEDARQIATFLEAELPTARAVIKQKGMSRAEYEIQKEFPAC